MTPTTAMTRKQLADLAAHLNAMQSAAEMIQRHVQESRKVILALMEEQGLASGREGLTTPEDRGS